MTYYSQNYAGILGSPPAWILAQNNSTMHGIHEQSTTELKILV